MVDFNNETTITRPASDILKVTMLQRRYDAINAIAWFDGRKKANLELGEGGLSKVYEPLSALFTDSKQMMKARMKKEEYDYLCLTLKKPDLTFLEMKEIFDLIDYQLYDVGLTKYDTGKRYDSTDIEEENKAKGL